MKTILLLSTERVNPLQDSVLKECLSLCAENNSEDPLRQISVESVRLKVPEIEGTTDAWQNSYDDVEVEHTKHEFCENVEETSCSLTEEKEQEFKFNDFFKLSKFLHEYADNHCEVGTTDLHVIWCVHLYAPCPSEVIEYFGVLERLHMWNNASINIVAKSAEFVKEWEGLMPINVTDSCSNIIDTAISSIWRGPLCFRNPDGSKEYFSSIVLKEYIPGKYPFGDCENSAVQPYILPVAEAVCSVDVSTITWLGIKRGIYSILVSEDSHSAERESLEKIFKVATETKDVGTLIRIRYSSTKPAVDNFDQLNTLEWKRCIAGGIFDTRPVFSFSSPHQCAMFLILPGGGIENKIFAVALQEVADCGDDVLRLGSGESLKPEEPLDDEDLAKLESLFESTKILKDIEVTAISTLLLKLPEEIKRRFTKKNVDKLWPEIKDQIECCTNEKFFEMTFEKFAKQAQYFKFGTKDTTLPPQYMLPMEKWPEYIALAEAEEAKNNREFRRRSSELLHGLAPPSQPTIMTNAKDILGAFEKNGNPKGKLTNFKGSTSGIFKGWRKEKNVDWPKSLESKIHGTHYNTGERSEIFESDCNRLKERYIKADTVSLCTSFRDKGFNYGKYILGRRKVVAGEKDSDSISDAASIHTDRGSEVLSLAQIKSKSNSKTNGLESDSIRSRKRPLEALNSRVRGLLGSSKVEDSGRQLKRRASSLENSENLPRRSPRKRGSLQGGLKPSDFLKPSERLLRSESYSKGKADRADKLRTLSNPESRVKPQHKHKVTKPADLDDLNKRKLRNAVMNALESENISQESPIFKPCFQKLFAVSKPFALDVIGIGSTSRNMEKITMSHVKQVIEFEQFKREKR